MTFMNILLKHELLLDSWKRLKLREWNRKCVRAVVLVDVLTNGVYYSFFNNNFCTNNRTFLSFFKTLNTKLKIIIVCNTGCPMFTTFHIVFISLKKPCIWFKILIIMKYHRNITLDHPHTIYPYIHCLVVSTIMRYICSEHMMPVSLLFYTFMHHCNRLERKVQTLESLIKMWKLLIK